MTIVWISCHKAESQLTRCVSVPELSSWWLEIDGSWLQELETLSLLCKRDDIQHHVLSGVWRPKMPEERGERKGGKERGRGKRDGKGGCAASFGSLSFLNGRSTTLPTTLLGLPLVNDIVRVAVENGYFVCILGQPRPAVASDCVPSFLLGGCLTLQEG